MGVLDLIKKDRHHGSDDLQNIRMHVLGKQGKEDEKNNKDDKDVTDHSHDSVEVKLIKISNDVETLKTKMDQVRTEILAEVNKVYADVESLSDLVKYVPKETLAELRNIKQAQPGAYDELKQIISEKVKSSIIDVIDANIIRLIKEVGELDSHALLQKVENGRVCSKNTLYIHLSRLTEKGVLAKKRVGHEVVYYAKQAQAQPQPAPQQPAPIQQQPAQPAAPVTVQPQPEVKAA
ncbi:MAG: BlaI/MecI/CopY family transcriptional regulator [Candidatus Aenigmarchaeota archaeon]|nr:BlaI/MecI/CopY family transcriptional regulator [Candidatus Aenigmarchaeota archaeon]